MSFSSGWGTKATTKQSTGTSGSGTGLQDLFSSQAKAPVTGVTALTSALTQPAKTSTGKGVTALTSLSNTGNTANTPINMAGVVTAKPGGKLNEAEVTQNANTAAAYTQNTLNSPNQSNPYGSSTWTYDEYGRPTNTITLNPEQQKLLDTQTQTQLGLGDVGYSLLDQVRNQYSNPLDFSGAPQLQNGNTIKGVNVPQLRTSIVPYGTIQNDVGDTGQIQDSVGNAGDIQMQVDTSGINPLTYSANRGQIQNQIDMSGVPSLVGGQDLVNFQNQARDAAWQNAQAALDPQWDTYESRLEQKLANQGVAQNSDAWNKAVSEMSRNRQYDYSQARNNAVRQGFEAADRLYSQGLSSNQNAFSQAMNRGNFANSAQQQDFDQNYQNATLGNQASMDMFNARRAVMSDNNAAQAQNYDQLANNMTLRNAAQDQRYNQAANTMTLHNTAQNQGWTQNQADAEFGNNARLGQFGMDTGNAELNNSAVNQDFQNSLTGRQQYINELMAQRNEPLTALTSILQGTSPTMPTFNTSNTVGGVDSANTLGNLSATKQANAATTAAKYSALGNIASSVTSAINPLKKLGLTG